MLEQCDDDDDDDDDDEPLFQAGFSLSSWFGEPLWGRFQRFPEGACARCRGVVGSKACGLKPFRTRCSVAPWHGVKAFQQFCVAGKSQKLDFWPFSHALIKPLSLIASHCLEE